MKKILLIIVSLNLFSVIYSQSSDDLWTKDARTELANECLSLLGTKYPNLSDEQTTTVAICYTNAIVTTYKRNDWLNRMEIEIKKIKSNALAQCLKSSGVDSSTPKIEEKPKPEPAKIDTPEVTGPSLKTIAGVWAFEGGRKFTFTEGGTYLFEGNNKICNGTWNLTKKTISLNPSSDLKNKFALCGNEEFEIVSFKPTEILLLKTGSRDVLNLKRIN